MTDIAPRLTRKALNARIAELEAENAGLLDLERGARLHIAKLVEENADLFAEIADKKDRLARFEKPAPAPAPAPINLSLTLPAGVDAFEVGNQFGQLLSAIAPGAKLRFAGGAL